MAKFELGGSMGTRTITIAADEPIGYPKRGHGFPLSEGISRQAIERHAEEHARARHRGKRLAAEAKAQFDIRLKAATEALAAKDAALDRSRTDELQRRWQFRELEDRSKSRGLEYQRRLDEECKKIEEKTRASIGDEFSRREAQLKAESAQREAADLKRKLEQGSQQTQGEALEVSVEAMLKSAFPMVRAAPRAQGRDRRGTPAARALALQAGLRDDRLGGEADQELARRVIPKLKDDQQAVGAELAMLVSSAMPRDTREPFLREGARFEAAHPSPRGSARPSSRSTSSASPNRFVMPESAATLSAARSSPSACARSSRVSTR